MTDPSSSTAMQERTAVTWLRRHRLVIVWVAIMLVVTAIDTATVVADARRHGRPLDLSWAILLEGTSHLVLGAMVPLLYWFHRHFPLVPPGPAILAHLPATVPFSLIHVLAMSVLRWALAPLLDRTYAINLGFEALLYEYRKDAVTYLILSTAIVAMSYVFAEKKESETMEAPEEAPPPAAQEPANPAGRLERFAVRRKDKEILVSAQDIAWIEAAGNYAILHVGGERYDIRSSLARLEAELDPARFVRVHKSYIVNVERVREVEPWISGDSRLKLDDGAVVSLSRRYRSRFEKVVPVRT
jgi:hypothetical protein